MSPLFAAEPPDDTGSQTLQRFRYQAKVAFPYVLSCGLGGDEISVVPEHYEDLAIQYAERWRLVQIKSRDASRGMWTLSDLLASDGGALRSLYRAFTAMAETEATYELLLELPVSPHSLLHRLAGESTTDVHKLGSKVATALKIDASRARLFLARVRLLDPLPGRDHIDGVNLRLLLAHAPHLPAGACQRIYVAALDKIESAMRAESVGVPWPKYLALDATQRSAQVLAAKTLSRDVCEELFDGLSPPANRLLRRAVDHPSRRATTLETKMVLGGAPNTIVESAIRLRALAVATSYETACASNPDSGAYLEDLLERLYHRTIAIVEKHRATPYPATAIWNELMSVAAAEAAALDPNNLVGKDQMLLIGHVCELSDECRTGWGGPDA